MRWRIEQQDDGTWSVIRPDGTVVQQGITASAAGLDDARARAIDAMVAAIGGGEALRALVAAPEPAADGEPAADAEPTPGVALGTRWESDAAFEGVVTNDGRVLQDCTFRDPPLPLMMQTVTAMGHDGAELVGFSDVGERVGTGEGSVLRMAGVFSTSDDGAEAVALLTEHGTFGVSVDVGWPEDYTSECVQLDDDGWCERWRDTYIGTPVMGLTMTPFPAFASARIWLEGVTPPPLAQQDTLLSDAPAPVEPTAEDDLLMLLASAGSLDAPPIDWFRDPEFTAEHPDMEFSSEGCPLGVPMTVTDDGRVYGHVATWSQCHTGYTDRCVLAPRSEGAAYAWYRTGYAQGPDGEKIATGNITMGTGHADLSLGAREAMAHYDNSGTAVAQVAAGEDEFGIWFSGALMPGVTADQVRLLRSLSLSGDWRPVGGKLEMIAALAVNVPGFPIPRGLRAVTPRELVASAMPAMREHGGEVVAMVAAGMVVNKARRLSADGSPWGREVERRLRALETVAEPLRASAARAVRERAQGL